MTIDKLNTDWFFSRWHLYLKKKWMKGFATGISTYAIILSFLAFSFSFSKQARFKVLLNWYFIAKKHKIVVIFNQIWWDYDVRIRNIFSRLSVPRISGETRFAGSHILFNKIQSKLEVKGSPENSRQINCKL